MSANFLRGHGPDYYKNRCINLSAAVTYVGRNYGIPYHSSGSKTHIGDLESSLTEASLKKAKITAIHFNNWEDSVQSFKERLVRQTEERKTPGGPALPVSMNTDSSQATKMNDTDVPFNHIFPWKKFLCQNTGISF